MDFPSAKKKTQLPRDMKCWIFDSRQRTTWGLKLHSLNSDSVVQLVGKMNQLFVSDWRLEMPWFLSLVESRSENTDPWLLHFENRCMPSHSWTWYPSRTYFVPNLIACIPPQAIEAIASENLCHCLHWEGTSPVWQPSCSMVMKDWRNCMLHGISLASQRSLSYFLADSCFMFKTYSRVLNRDSLCYPCVPKRYYTCFVNFSAAYVQVPFEFDQQHSCLMSRLPFEANSWAKGRSTCYVRYTHFAPRRGDILEAANAGDDINTLWIYLYLYLYLYIYIHVYPNVTPDSFMLSAQPCIHLFLFPFQEKCGFNSQVLVPSWVNSAFEKVHLTIQNAYGTMHWSQRNRHR